jgi:uncharacterized membrane protein
VGQAVPPAVLSFSVRICSTIPVSPSHNSCVTTRIQSVDALRGLIMIVMALDHTRDFFHSAAMQFQPEDLARTTAAIFFTRWITHFCAPVFMFTAGMGAFFWLQRHTKAQLSAFLAKRGLWLIVLDLTAVRFAMTWGQGMFIINVLWGLGWAMIALALLIHLPMRALAFLSIAVMALHNLADPINLPGIHQIGVFQIGTASIVIAYTLIPWFAVMSAGFCFGEIFTKHKSWMPAIGLSLTAAFLILRTINLYGDPVRWSGGILSFLRCNKYPPSLDFLLMTLGPAILLLSFFDKRQFRPFNPLLIFGRVPLFYFLVHLYVIHLLAVLLAWLRYGKLVPVNPQLKIFPQGYGYDLWAVYVIWIGIVVIIYPLCLWFANIKQRRHDWWLSYL